MLATVTVLATAGRCLDNRLVAGDRSGVSDGRLALSGGRPIDGGHHGADAGGVSDLCTVRADSSIIVNRRHGPNVGGLRCHLRLRSTWPGAPPPPRSAPARPRRRNVHRIVPAVGAPDPSVPSVW